MAQWVVWFAEGLGVPRSTLGKVYIEISKICIFILESFGGIFRYSKEWQSFTIDRVSKSAQNTHLTAEPILKQCTFMVSDRLWFPTSDRLETWLILSGTLRSKQYHDSRVNHVLTQPALVPPLIVLTSALSRSFRRKGQDKVPKTMVWG